MCFLSVPTPNPPLSATVLPHPGLFMSHLNIAAAYPKARRVLPTLQANGAIPRQTPFKGTRDKVVRSKLASVESRLFTHNLPPVPPTGKSPVPSPLPSFTMHPIPRHSEEPTILWHLLHAWLFVWVNHFVCRFFPSSVLFQRPVAFRIGAHHSPLSLTSVSLKALAGFLISCMPQVLRP